MSKPKVMEINVETGEEIVREMNEEEYAQFLADKSEHDKKIAEDLAKEEAKASALAKLQKLGLSEEEVAAFIS